MAVVGNAMPIMVLSIAAARPRRYRDRGAVR